jgi:hypothetical protein
VARGDARAHSNRTQEQVNTDIDRDKILSAEEALEYGLIDQVLTSRKSLPALDRVARPADAADRPAHAVASAGVRRRVRRRRAHGSREREPRLHQSGRAMPPRPDLGLGSETDSS